jgi:hypothetical protein
MKAMMILGANVGFVLGLSASIFGECSWPVAFWHAGATALAGGLLGRWWGRVWLAELNSALEQRHRERMQAEESKSKKNQG